MFYCYDDYISSIKLLQKPKKFRLYVFAINLIIITVSRYKDNIIDITFLHKISQNYFHWNDIRDIINIWYKYPPKTGDFLIIEKRSLKIISTKTSAATKDHDVIHIYRSK